jgi:low temperature requirement protein LtrA
VSEQHVEREQRVTPLELFFDLVFVFAITQVTSYLADHGTWAGFLEGLLVLAALWWAWAAYAWLTNSIDADEGAARLAMLAAMGAMLVVSLAVPNAFGENGVLFGVAYFVVRVLHIALYATATRGDHDVVAAVLRMTPTATLAPALIVIAGFLDGSQQIAMWVVALALDYLGVLVGRGAGWRVSAEHFAERHALIVIIALGESIVALGVGAAGAPVDEGVVAAAVLGIAVVAALWWMYFDVVAIVAARRLAQATGVARATQARDSYSYLHLPMVAGIVVFALALKKTLADVGEPLGTIPAVALCGGVALYLLAHVAFRLRNIRTLNRQRLLVAAALIAFVPFADELPALAALGVVAATCSALVVYEAIRFREARARIRHAQPAS